MNEKIQGASDEAELGTFTSIRDAELKNNGHPSWNSEWLFIDRKVARGENLNYNFYGYEGPRHLAKFFNWLSPLRFPDYLDQNTTDRLANVSIERDAGIFRRLGIEVSEQALKNVAILNAQDYCFQRLYPVPGRQKIRRILEIGSGHGRMANLAFGAPDSETELFVSIDGIPAPYLTQRLYYQALGLDVVDYIFDMPGAKSLDFGSITDKYDLLHLPTWRTDLLPNDTFDMVCCVQVLKELPPNLVIHLLQEIKRVLKPGGAFYVRDHPQFHNPNQLPHDHLYLANGFILEFNPYVIDRRELWGVPRIYRKFDPKVYTECHLEKARRQ